MATNNGNTLSAMDQTEKDELYEAYSVLAGSDPDNCSYPKGYMKRQAVFACNTCMHAGMEPAGVCLACANSCHDGHDIFELYTKRNFRCDCGNEKFAGLKCKLHSAKDRCNANNKYDHNYFGRYCSCDRPYPDAEDQVNDEMIQCIVCEDWYHEKHLGCPVVNSEELLEMVCEGCMNRAPFLWTYAAHFAVSSLNQPDLCKERTDADVMGNEKETFSLCTSRQDMPSVNESCQNEEMQAASNGTMDQYTTHDSMRCHLVPRHSNITKCILKELEVKDLESTKKGAVFWPYYWRAKLCTCIGCKRMYVETCVPFLLDESDTMLAYEEKARTEALTSENLLLSCLSSFDHVQQLEIIYQYNDLKKEFHEFLQQFAGQSKEVTPEIFREFLVELQTRQKKLMDTESH